MPRRSTAVIAGADSIRISALYLSAITTYELELGILQLERKGEGKTVALV